MGAWDWSVEYWINGIVLTCVAAIGIAGNLVCVRLLSTPSSRPNATYHNLLKWLAAIDCLFLVSCFFTFSLQHLSYFYRLWVYPYLMPALLPITSTLLTASVFCVLSLTIERFFCLCKPSYMNKGSFLGYILPLSVFSIFFNIPKFFELKTEYVERQGEFLPFVLPTEMRKSPEYSYYTIGTGFFFIGLIPLLCIIILNSLVVKKKRSSGVDIATGYREDRVSTSLLFGVVFLMVGCHLPRTILNVYEMYLASISEELKFPYPWLVDVSHLFLALSSTLNIFIYSVQDTIFRENSLRCIQRLSFLCPHGPSNPTHQEEEEGGYHSNSLEAERLVAGSGDMIDNPKADQLLLKPATDERSCCQA